MGATTAQQLVKEAMQLHQRGELQQAKTIYEEVLEISPRHPDALHLYGLACHQQGDHLTAVSYIRRAIELVPDQAVLRNNLGDALCKAGEFEDALTQLQVALDLRPNYAGAHQNLGTAYAHTGDFDTALLHARKAVQLDSRRPEAWFDLGLILLEHVLLDESVDAFRSALVLRPVYPLAATSLLYTLNLLPGADPAVVTREHQQVATAAFNTIHTPVVRKQRSGRIRIAYVSRDFRSHAVNYFFEPVLAHHDKSRFEVFCYSDVAQPDQVSRRLQEIVEHWHDIPNWDDERVCEQVRLDGIDILVDLAGHTKHNRLGVFAVKPAPCQLSWLGFPNTTGLRAMDYRVVDHYTAPDEDDFPGSEDPLRLADVFACFRPPGDSPPVHPAPLVHNGFITLGCLHKLEKLNTGVIALWARILSENPETRLLLVRDQLDDWQQQRLRTSFLQHGISSDRLMMNHLSDSQQDFFELFGKIDILLDTFPWSGHTLACCALWMGVPVVSMKGNSHAGRMVASVLNLLGLNELIAEDTEAYNRIASDLCSDKDRLIRYRNTLRDRCEQSPLRDEKGFTKKLEAEYRSILKL